MSIDKSNTLALFNFKPVAGRASNSFIYLHKQLGYFRNSFQDFLKASMKETAQGTEIKGKVGMHAFVTLFSIVWFSMAILLGGPMMITILIDLFTQSDSHHLKDTWLSLVNPLIFPLFGYGLIRVGRYLARNEYQFLKDFLIQTLDAREINDGSV